MFVPVSDKLSALCLTIASVLFFPGFHWAFLFCSPQAATATVLFSPRDRKQEAETPKEGSFNRKTLPPYLRATLLTVRAVFNHRIKVWVKGRRTSVSHSGHWQPLNRNLLRKCLFHVEWTKIGNGWRNYIIFFFLQDRRGLRSKIKTFTLWVRVSTAKCPHCQNVTPHQEMCHSVRDSLMGWSTLPGLYRWASLTFALHVWQSMAKHMAAPGRGGVCVRRCLCKAGGSGKWRATRASPGPSQGHAGCRLAPAAQCCGLHWQNGEKVLWFLAQREGHSVRVTFTPQHPETSAAPHETNSAEKPEKWTRAPLHIAWDILVHGFLFLFFNDWT